MRIALVIALALTGASCAPNFIDGQFICTSDSQCPAGFFCDGRVCNRGVPADTGSMDSASVDASAIDVGDMDGGADAAGPDASVRTISIASAVNPAAANHPVEMETIRITATSVDTTSAVALTPRIFLSQAASTGRCFFGVWVGTHAGGDFSGLEVVDSFVPSAGGDCMSAPANVIPATVMIGDLITPLIGQFTNFCSPGPCPRDTAQELLVAGGTFTIGAHVMALPLVTTVPISDIDGTGTTLAPRDAALQGALVRLTNVEIRVEPTMANFSTMLVAASGTTTPTMPVVVSRMGGLGCQQSAIWSMPVGGSLGDVTGVLLYTFGQWVLQPRQGSDFSGVVCSPTDAGVPTD